MSTRIVTATTRCPGSSQAAGTYYIGPASHGYPHGYPYARCSQCEHMGLPTRDGRINAHKATSIPNEAWSSHPQAHLVTINFEGHRPGAEDMAELFIQIFHEISIFDDGNVVMISHDKRTIRALVQRPTALELVEGSQS